MVSISLTPTTEAVTVDMVISEYRFIQGGNMRLMHCGRMI